MQELIGIYRDPVMYGSARNPIVTEQDARHWLEVQEGGWADGGRLSFAILCCAALRRARLTAWSATLC
jgi:hypothetical protein